MTRETAVIIAAYNAERTIERAVRSALAQPEVSEIFVADDCSTDATAEIVCGLAAADPRVRLDRAERNAGPSAARNIAINGTTAPWIAVLDADDFFLEGRLAALHAVAEGADFIADALIRVSPGVTPAAPLSGLEPKPLTLTEFALGNLGATRGPLDLGFLKPMFRRAFIQRYGLSYREDMRLGEDYEFYARALAHGAKFLTCGPAGYVSVERPGSLSNAHSELDLQRLRDCDDAIAGIRTLEAEERRAVRRHWNSVDCRLQWRRLISAVKRRDLGAAISTFRSPEAAVFLAARLGEQAWLRGATLASGNANSRANSNCPQQG